MGSIYNYKLIIALCDLCKGFVHYIMSFKARLWTVDKKNAVKRHFLVYKVFKVYKVHKVRYEKAENYNFLIKEDNIFDISRDKLDIAVNSCSKKYFNSKPTYNNERTSAQDPLEIKRNLLSS